MTERAFAPDRERLEVVAQVWHGGTTVGNSTPGFTGSMSEGLQTGMQTMVVDNKVSNERKRGPKTSTVPTVVGDTTHRRYSSARILALTIKIFIYLL